MAYVLRFLFDAPALCVVCVCFRRKRFQVLRHGITLLQAEHRMRMQRRRYLVVSSACSVYMFVCLFVWLVGWLVGCLDGFFGWLVGWLCVCLCVCFVCVCLFVFVCLFVCVFVCLFVCVFVC